MTDQAPVPSGPEAEEAEAVPAEEFACPFCGEMSTIRYRGKHFAQHRRLGDVPLPLTAEIVKNDQGTFDIKVTLTHTGKPVLVSRSYQGRSTKKSAEKALRTFMNATANGTGKPPGSRKKVVTAVEVKDKPEQTSASELADNEILKALTKLTGVTSIPFDKLNLVLDWVEQTRTLAKEITR